MPNHFKITLALKQCSHLLFSVLLSYVPTYFQVYKSDSTSLYVMLCSPQM